MTYLFDSLRYPDERPGYRHRDTSKAAAKAIAPKAAPIRRRLLAYFETAELTADEACELAGVSVLTGRPRITEASKLGLLTDTGKRRRNSSGRFAAVWSRAERVGQ